MKHFILVIALFAASNFAAVAQSLTLGDGHEMSFDGFSTIPGCWTSTGKSYITNVDIEEEINIYSLNGESVATISNPYSKIAREKKFYTDSFKNVVEINWENERLFEYWKEEDFDGQIVCYEKDSTGIEGAKALLDSIYNIDSDSYKWVIFTDASGREGIYDENDYAGYGFYNEDEFGHKYPESYYTFLGDNLLYFMRVGYSYETVLDEENATWTADEDGSYYTSNLGTCHYYDITDFIEDQYISFTQTLYNDDDKWEYWIREFDVKEESHYDWYSSVDAKYYRMYYYENTVKKYVLMNSDGKKLCEIPVAKRDCEYYYSGSYLLLLKDEDGYYIAIQECYYDKNDTDIDFLTTYKIDRKTNQITKVSERKNRLDVGGAAAVKGERLKITVDGGKDGESVVISDMSGRVVSTADAKEEGTYINTGGMASGIYNVTLQSKAGKENKRIVIR